ncbi:hypothetical protein, partial [Rugosimonospora africana]|uniref:hypothetical protein n=1 Tax=Rugosimonospora africana TaxID=556532 RepID=UPI0019411892
MSPLRVLVRSGRFRRAVAASAALLIAGWLPLVDSAPASAQSGRAPVTEIFTGAPPPSTTVSVASLALLKTATPSVVTTAGQNVDY